MKVETNWNIVVLNKIFEFRTAIRNREKILKEQETLDKMLEDIKAYFTVTKGISKRGVSSVKGRLDEVEEEYKVRKHTFAKVNELKNKYNL